MYKKITGVFTSIMAVYDIEDSVSMCETLESMCKHWKARVGTCVQVNAGGYTQNLAYVCLIFGRVRLYKICKDEKTIRKIYSR